MEKPVSNKVESVAGSVSYWEAYCRLMKNPPTEMQEYFDVEDGWLLSRVTPEMDVLDVGSGNGRTMRALADRVKTITGIDDDQQMVIWSQQSTEKHSNAKSLLRDAYSTGFADNSFDVVICAFNFLGNPEIKERGVTPLLDELSRITKDGGRMIFTLWRSESLEYSQKLYTEVCGCDEAEIDWDRLVIKASFGESQRFTPEMIRDLLSPLGCPFTIEELTPLFYAVEVTKPTTSKA